MFMKIGEAAARHSIKRNAINYLVRTGTIETRQDAQGVTLVNVEHLLTHLASKAKTTTSVVHELAQTVQNEHVNMPPTPAAVAPAQTQTADPRLEAVLAAVGELTARVNAVQVLLTALPVLRRLRMKRAGSRGFSSACEFHARSNLLPARLRPERGSSPFLW